MPPNLGYLFTREHFPLPFPWPMYHLDNDDPFLLWCHAISGALDTWCAAAGGGDQPAAGTCMHTLILFADCSQPLDVILLLDGSSSIPASYFEEMKNFAKTFISKANIGEQSPWRSLQRKGSTWL